MREREKHTPSSMQCAVQEKFSHAHEVIPIFKGNESQSTGLNFPSTFKKIKWS